MKRSDDLFYITTDIPTEVRRDCITTEPLEADLLLSSSHASVLLVLLVFSLWNFTVNL